jgi:hypothetical protein
MGRGFAGSIAATERIWTKIAHGVRSRILELALAAPALSLRS